MVEGKDKTTVESWRAMLNQAMEKLEIDDPRREVMCEEIPGVVVPKAVKQEKKVEVREEKGKQKEGEEVKKVVPTPTPAAAAPVAAVPSSTGAIAPGGKVRHEWYQTNEDVVLTLYVKNVPKDKATIDIHDTSVCLLLLPSLPHAFFANHKPTIAFNLLPSRHWY